jgi:hypothetical protein
MKKNPANSKETNSNKLLEDAAKKLKKIEEQRNQAEKYFKEREVKENKMKLLESNLKKKVVLEKRASLGLEEKTLEQITLLLSALANIDTNLLNKVDDKFARKSSEGVQTEKDDTANLIDKLSLLEKNNEKYYEKKKDYEKEIELLKIEIENIKQFNDKLTKENKLLSSSLDETNNSKLKVEKKLNELQTENLKLNENINKLSESLKDYESLKKIMEDNLNTEKEISIIGQSIKNNLIEKKSIHILFENNCYENILTFLRPQEIHNLRLTNQQINNKIENNLVCMNFYYKSIIRNLKWKLDELGRLDIKKEYMVGDTEVERLVKEYNNTYIFIDTSKYQSIQVKT